MSTASCLVNLQLRKTIIGVFCARDFHLKSVDMAAKEAKVNEEYFHSWMNRIVNDLDNDLDKVKEEKKKKRKKVSSKKKKNCKAEKL